MTGIRERLDRIRRQQASAPPVTPETAAAALTDVYEVLTGSGAHADHDQEQAGPCVHCSCGARVQGRLTPDGIPGPAHRHGGPGAGWYVPCPDGWQRVTDAEASEHRYPDMAHFMHDPRETDHGDPQPSEA